MNLRWRRVYYASAFIAFFIAAPLLVLYAFGYRLNWREREFQQTGAVAITTSPRGATVWLNGLELNKSTPLQITNLAPRQYDLLVTKANFRNWQHKLSVAPSQSANINNLVLFKAETTIDQIWSGPTGLSSLAPDGSGLAVISRSDNFSQLAIVDPNNKRQTTTSLPSGSEYTSIKWSSDGKSMLLSCSTGSVSCFYVYKTADLSSTNLTELAGRPIKQAWWSAEQADLIFALTPDQLVLIDLYSRQVAPVWTGRVGDFLAHKTGGFFTDQTTDQTRLMVYDPTIGSPESLTTLTGSAYRFWPGPSDNFALEDTATHQITLNQFPDARRLIQIPLDHPGQFITWDRFGRSLLFGDGHELYAYNLETDRYQLITRQIEPYQTAVWFPAGSAVIMIDRGRLQAINLVNGEPTEYQYLFNQAGLKLLGLNKSGAIAYLEWVENDQAIIAGVTIQ